MAFSSMSFDWCSDQNSMINCHSISWLVARATRGLMWKRSRVFLFLVIDGLRHQLLVERKSPDSLERFGFSKSSD
jgi:hypothetical protein